MAQTYRMCNVWGEPLSQTAQSFMPEMLYGANRNLPKARTLLKSLMIIGATLGLVLGIIGTTVPGLFPGVYTHDKVIINEVCFCFSNQHLCPVFSILTWSKSDSGYVYQMHRLLIPFFMALSALPMTVSLEGTLLVNSKLLLSYMVS